MISATALSITDGISVLPGQSLTANGAVWPISAPEQESERFLFSEDKGVSASFKNIN